MATICNMGAGIGETTSVFPFKKRMEDYLVATGRTEITQQSEKYSKVFLNADSNALYDKVIEINLSEYEPHVNGPFTPDLPHPIFKLGETAKKNDLPPEIRAGILHHDFYNLSENFNSSSMSGQ
ncbi:uncharacterized protein [Hetaerina americana]|uniref:uncharacterized protein n=1 Tax=Hetaerina americana TaxID=62018 RepID=UPI003A7F5321